MASKECTMVLTTEDWLAHVADAEPGEEFALDLETTGLSPWIANIAVVGLYRPKTNMAAVLHFPKLNSELPPELVTWLSSPDRFFTVFNGVGFDWYFLWKAGIDIFGPAWFDSMIAEGCTVKAARRDVKVSLAASYKRRLGSDLKKEIDHRTWQLPSLTQEQLSYVAADIMHLPRLKAAQLLAIEGDSRAQANDIEQQVSLAVAQMTINGMPIRMVPIVDEATGQTLQSFPAYIKMMEECRDDFLHSIKPLIGEINPNSPAQVKKAFASLGLTLPSTGEAVLVRVRDNREETDPCHIVAKNILAYRLAGQRAKIYKDSWFESYVHPKLTDSGEFLSWVVRARYWQIGTETGRFSSSDPNMQQVAADCRTFFGEEPGSVCLTADYSQLEVRIAAWLAKDEILLEALDAEDVHTGIASALFQIPYDMITPEQRKLSKSGTFTFLFGGGAKLLHEQAITDGGSITLREAQEFEAEFFSRFQGLARQRAWAYSKCKTAPAISITMPHGLIRHLSGDTMRPTVLLNTKVQGGAASGLKLAMILMRNNNLMPYVRSTVHDEFVVTAPPALMGTDFQGPLNGEVAPAIRWCMEQGMLLAFPDTINGRSFPVKVDGTIGPRWKGAKPLDLESIRKKAKGTHFGN